MRSFETLIAKFLKNIDIFGYKTELKIQSKSDYRTLMGGTLTVMMFILGLMLLVYFDNDMYYKINPSVFRSQMFEKEPTVFLNFQKKLAFLCLGLKDL